MANTTDTINTNQVQEVGQKAVPLSENVRQALHRLRQRGEALPPIDAVAVIRDGRDADERSNR